MRDLFRLQSPLHAMPCKSHIYMFVYICKWIDVCFVNKQVCSSALHSLDVCSLDKTATPRNGRLETVHRAVFQIRVRREPCVRVHHQGVSVTICSLTHNCRNCTAYQLNMYCILSRVCVCVLVACSVSFDSFSAHPHSLCGWAIKISL